MSFNESTMFPEIDKAALCIRKKALVVRFPRSVP